MLNIPSTVEDPNYRYKMPKLVSKIEGRGNGIRTKIVNMADIAKSLKRPPSYPTKFFGCELGALSKWEDKEEKSIVNGAHQQPDLQRLMDKFILMYVLCPNCELPEIDLSVKKERVSCKCNACGHTGLLDNNHKITTYISKNPPGGIDSTMGSSSKSKKDRRDKEKDRDKNSDQSNSVLNKNSGETYEKTSKSKIKKKKNKKSSGESCLCEKESLTFDSQEIADVVERLNNYILKNNETMTVDDFFSELRVLQVSQDFDANLRFYVALVAFFGLNEVIDPKVFKLRTPFISRVVDGSLRSNAILSIFETYCVERNPHTLVTYPYLLQQLYDSDILSERSILKYYQRDSPTSSGSYCSSFETFEKAKLACKPFIEWLLDGSDDDDDNDDDYDENGTNNSDCEEETPSSSATKNSNIKVKSLNVSKGTQSSHFIQDNEETGTLDENTPQEESDVDIDNI
ncbi:eukaryotic translation initiation factor 5, putative [Cryptosporidium muris RN66]|uniref:Eukaryotic translation initiation factor 5, putative n=1 Tax=Cryptosporidium muris (strain RN66) TaxID=441375 RepID=B6AFS3_CRYMR|nr:eukaryotic translation initiation factor 5, putative [Cryptosporidium muris RN66]EEA07064.1 eukaryotic translation initiation factor 5, putative [Cryptosporidium muris RN66]|eukprot:XP_002141413.1 eukaryotic translation initiation factor 5 [Cryptosporidium muris RN66]